MQIRRGSTQLPQRRTRARGGMPRDLARSLPTVLVPSPSSHLALTHPHTLPPPSPPSHFSSGVFYSSFERVERLLAKGADFLPSSVGFHVALQEIIGQPPIDEVGPPGTRLRQRRRIFVTFSSTSAGMLNHLPGEYACARDNTGTCIQREKSKQTRALVTARRSARRSANAGPCTPRFQFTCGRSHPGALMTTSTHGVEVNSAGPRKGGQESSANGVAFAREGTYVQRYGAAARR